MDFVDEMLEAEAVQGLEVEEYIALINEGMPHRLIIGLDRFGHTETMKETWDSLKEQSTTSVEACEAMDVGADCTEYVDARLTGASHAEIMETFQAPGDLVTYSAARGEGGLPHAAAKDHAVRAKQLDHPCYYWAYYEARIEMKEMIEADRATGDNLPRVYLALLDQGYDHNGAIEDIYQYRREFGID